MAQKRIAILYESIEGHTQTVAQRLGLLLQAQGFEVIVKRCREAEAPDLQAEGLVLGSSIHVGRHNAKAVRFAKNHLDALKARPAAFFLVCLTARSLKSEHQATVEGYLRDFSALTGWEPGLRKAFAGALLYTKYNFIKRKLMLSIVKKEGGDIDPSKNYIYTDWQAVEAFAEQFGKVVGNSLPIQKN